MASKREIRQKEAEWEALNQKYQTALDMAARCYESGMSDMGETYKEEAEALEGQMFDLENWLVNMCAPGWVAG